MSDSLSDIFDSYVESSFISPGVGSSDDIFSMLHEVVDQGVLPDDEYKIQFEHWPLVSPKSNSSCNALEEQLVEEAETVKMNKRQKVLVEEGGGDKVTHIAVERNRRKQMNNHLTVLRSLMPCFYVKRGDQASIIGGVVDYITELQQVLQSLEAKKQRKVYDHVLSPRPSPPLLLSPRKPPISPRPLLLPISPTTPQPISPYRPPAAARLHQQTPSIMAMTTPAASSLDQLTPSSCSSTTSDFVNASSKSSIADVEVKFSGSNLVVKTISPQLAGQTTKIVSLLEDLSLEILQAGINTVDQTMVNSFTLKIGIECELSAEDLVQHIQHTFC